MEDNTSGNRTAWPIGAFLLVIGLMLGIWTIRKHYSVTTAPVPKEIQWMRTTDTNLHSNAPAVSQSTQDKLVARAMLLRGEWRGWALTHQRVLKELSTASDTSESAILRLAQSFPLSFNPSDIGCIRATDLNSKDGTFTWNMYTGYWDPSKRTYSTIQARENRLEYTATYKQCHDLPLCDSTTNGEVVRLWASGKVTIGKIATSKSKIHDQLATMKYRVEKTIAPAFIDANRTTPTRAS